ncbi:MAG: sigma 54-interacting transcriptional regulator [Myxococcales bacterium]|nr:sigma 54-interacting transcriptional regulator [Myxococcales bacterium]
MVLFAGEARQVAQAIAALCFENPYVASYVDLQRLALGQSYREPSPGDGTSATAANAAGLAERAEQLLETARSHLADGATGDPADLQLYEGLVRYHLFGRLSELLEVLAQATAVGGLTRRRVSSYRLFEQEAERLLRLPGQAFSLATELPHLFAMMFQQRRARYLLDAEIVGHARVVSELRANLWASLFTHDLRRYGESLFDHMDSLPTLLGGPDCALRSRAARVLALGRYIPFDAQELRFTHEPGAAYRALDPTALASASLEGALFGGDGIAGEPGGLLGAVGERGAAFVDSLHALSRPCQIRLLGALDEHPRLGSPLGAESDGAPSSFAGKLIAGTSCDLLVEMREGRFAEALYYAVSADTVEVPSLALQLRQRPEDLRLHLGWMLDRLVPGSERARALAEVESLVERELGQRYPWPGNLFELRRCVRSVLVRGTYRPPRPAPRVHAGIVGTLSRRFADGDFNADGLLDAYCTLMYRQTGSYQEAARRLGLDRRTVKSRVDATLLAELS